MKTTTFTFLALLILTLPAARGEDFRTNINPALLYYQAFLMAPKPMSDADADYFYSKEGQSQKLPERFGQIIAGYDNEFKLVRAGAQQKVPCDWGIDMSPGPGTLLPQLAPVKAVAVASRPRVMWDLQHGDQIGARDDLLAAFVLGRNASRDGTLIGALVQDANEAIIYATVAANFGRFSPETLKQLVAGFDAAPARGTMATAMMTEKLNHVDWIVNKIRKLQRENPGNDAKVMAAIREDDELLAFDQYGGDDKEGPNFWQRVFAAAGGTSDGILNLLRESEPLYLRLVKIMTLPPPEYEDQIQKFAVEIQKSQNPFVKLLFPDPLLPRVKEFRIQSWQAMVRAAVEYKLHGEAGLKRVTDPFGNGPFAFQRFVFEGVDRGFELKSAYTYDGVPCALIFVEKEGTPFYTDGPHIGQAVKP
ncbi:MAG: hypothetical protein WBW41_03870 [Verrucomicrobiia bacterium]